MALASTAGAARRRPEPVSPQARLGYNGQLHEAGLDWQILGNGYRVYNPTLMRFHSPDSLSPFGDGGVNAYAYCGGDPVNQLDPTGHWSIGAFAGQLFGFKLRTPLMTPVLAVTAASLAAVGIAVASPNDTQRNFAIAGAVIAAAGSLLGAKYVWSKRKPFSPPSQKGSPSPVLQRKLSTHTPGASRDFPWPEVPRANSLPLPGPAGGKRAFDKDSGFSRGAWQRNTPPLNGQKNGKGVNEYVDWVRGGSLPGSRPNRDSTLRGSRRPQ